ncbi:uncharacterized protein LOC134077043 [Sardina pilchardus]|uniref:uncharacterized protein LOC134077043 n=1 Tax=Sardina pilchardus TaxID=27697 RepID=UPI002E0E0376
MKEVGDTGRESGDPDEGREGRRGGLPNLPCILLTNAHSIGNKLEDLRNRIRNDEEFQRCDLIFITETWVKKEHIENNKAVINVEGYEEKHFPRDTDRTKKKKGGGLGVLIKNGGELTKRDEKQTPCYQLVAFSYEARNQPPLYFILVYIQKEGKNKKNGNWEITKQGIEQSYRKGLNNGGPVFILGDFNWYKGFDNNDTFHQYVTCRTRKNNNWNGRTEYTTLDKCYGNVPEAYSSQCRPPLRSRKTESDHCITLLTPEHTTCTHDKWWLTSRRNLTSSQVLVKAVTTRTSLLLLLPLLRLVRVL